MVLGLTLLVETGYSLHEILSAKSASLPYPGWSVPQFYMLLNAASESRRDRQTELLSDLNIAFAAAQGSQEASARITERLGKHSGRQRSNSPSQSS